MQVHNFRRKLAGVKGLNKNNNNLLIKFKRKYQRVKKIVLALQVVKHHLILFKKRNYRKRNWKRFRLL